MASSQSPSSSSPSLSISHRIPPIHAVTTSSTSSSSTGATQEEEKKELVSSLRDRTMRGHWRWVLGIYRLHKGMVQTAKITSSNETALHIAITASQIDVVEALLQIIDADVIREMTNDRKENPLHLAASLGQTKTCKLLVDKDPKLIGARNIDGENPLFQAARNGKKGAFYALHPKCPITGLDIKHEICHCLKEDGTTILHVSIIGEYFELAFQIIYWYPELMEYTYNKGQTALHLLAQNPSAFRSWCDLGFVEEFIYRSLIVDSAKFEIPSDFKEDRSNITSPILENYKICLDLLNTGKKVINATVSRVWKWKGITGNKDMEKQHSPVVSTSEERRQATEDPNPVECNCDHINAFHLLSKFWYHGGDRGIPDQATFSAFFRRSLQFAIELLLSALGLGFFQVTDIKKKKQKHIYATQVMEMLVCYATDEDSCWNPPTSDSNICDLNDHPNRLQSSEGYFLNPEFYYRNAELHTEAIDMDLRVGLREVLKRLLNLDDQIDAIQEISIYTQRRGTFADPLVQRSIRRMPSGTSESAPFLIAAKMGVVELVRSLLDVHPMAIHQEDVHKKNAVLLAVENKHPNIFKLLLEKYPLCHSIFEKTDNNGNTALHLAATLGKKQQWRISSAAIQMQWEIKWYNLVKSSMPSSLLACRNREGKTSMEVFEQTHENILANGVAWLNSTSQSCSVVAALIASVAYASATTVPGGDNGGTGIPILKGQPSFNIFTIASLVALCFSITSLTMFLSILTSNYMIQDFLYHLPMKLLAGLTSLFISIGAMLVSFCAGHFFNLGDLKQQNSIWIYAIICLPMSAYVLTQLRLYFSLIKAPF